MSAAVAESMAAGAHHPVGVERLDDGVLVSLGPGRYVNRAIGIGPALDESDVEAVERFFAAHDMPSSIQLSSTAGEATLALLQDRGYRAEWFRSVFVQSLPASPDRSAASGRHRIEEVDEQNVERWLEVLAVGNGIATSDARAISDEYGHAASSAPGSADFLAYDDDGGGAAIGCGSVLYDGSTAWLGGAATIPSHRGRGVQSELVRHRLVEAARQGCDLAAVTATPAGTSARNLVRLGFGLVDVQLVVTRR